MLLCDHVVQSRAAPFPSHDDAILSALPAGGGELARLVEQCPVRYVLNDIAYENCRAAAIEHADCLVLGFRELRVSHPHVWLEWSEPVTSAPQAKRRRAGVLVQSDGDGRSGKLTSAWMDDTFGVLQSPAFFVFDFGREISRGLGAYHVDRSDAGLYATYDWIWRHVDFRVCSRWLDTLRRRADSQFTLDTAAHRILQANLHDFPMFCAFQLMLSLPRVFASRPSTLAKLNKARARRGRAPLLDHIEVQMRLTDRCPSKVHAKAEGRETPRLHWVRGHLVSRHGRVFWRRSHVRGDAGRGRIAMRTVHVAPARTSRN